MKLVTTTADLTPYYSDRSIAAPLPRMKETGFRHIDMSIYSVVYKDSPWIASGDLWKKEVEDSINFASENGLDFRQAHAPEGVHFTPGEARDSLILAIRRSLEACSMLGIPHAVIHAQGVKGGTPSDFLRENIAFCKLFEEDTEKFGVDLLIENSASLWNPEYYLRTGKEMAEFVSMAKMPRLHICWDIGHANVQGRNQYDDIIAMGSELHALHVQDNYGDNDSHVMPMAGTTNFDNVIKGLIDSGYKGDFTFEGSCTLRRSKAWPHYRRDVSPSDKLSEPPIGIQIKQISVMYEIGKWMLESYGIPVE